MFNLKKKTSQPNKLALSEHLKRTRSSLFSSLFHRQQQIDQAILEQLEDRMISADIGLKTTTQVIQALTHHAKNADIEPEVLVKQLLLSVLKPVAQQLTIPDTSDSPFLILVIGVNGVGKTTTIGKLANWLQQQGNTVILAAGDTFRAAAIEQLCVWGERNKVKVIAQSHGADPSAVIYDALASARASKTNVVLADTAGRLHNQENLMQELKKIHRISSKFDHHLKREVLLVLDAGTGQNALTQAQQFHQAIGIDGVILTKLDGTAKGGIVFSLASELSIPIRFIGVGENIEDLRPFDANEFVDALFAAE